MNGLRPVCDLHAPRSIPVPPTHLASRDAAQPGLVSGLFMDSSFDMGRRGGWQLPVLARDCHAQPGQPVSEQSASTPRCMLPTEARLRGSERDERQCRGFEEQPQVLYRRRLGRSNRARQWEIVNPATEDPVAEIALGTAPMWTARSPLREPHPCFRADQPAGTARPPQAHPGRLHGALRRVRQLVSMEMGAPMRLCLDLQALAGVAHIAEMMRVLEPFSSSGSPA